MSRNEKKEKGVKKKQHKILLHFLLLSVGSDGNVPAMKIIFTESEARNEDLVMAVRFATGDVEVELLVESE